MNYWLVKSEPFKYSWEQFVRDGKTFWDGVRNYGARNNLRAMKKGDHVFFYHSNEGLAIVGIAEVLREAYQDPTTIDSNWVAVDLKPVKVMPRPVTLAQIKAEPTLQEMDLVRLSRLSVGTVKPREYKKILTMAGLQAGKGEGVVKSAYWFFDEWTKMKFEKEIATVLQSRRPDTDMLNVIEALGYGSAQFQQAFDIALEMDNRSLVKLLYSNFDAGKVIVEFTLLGKKPALSERQTQRSG